MTDLTQKYNRSLLENLIHEWINGKNGERDRIILSISMFDGVTLEEMQKRLDKLNYPLSIDRIKQVIAERTQQLERHIPV